MAVQKKYSIAKGQLAKDVVVAAGAAIGGSDALFVNIDVTHFTREQAILALDQVKRYIMEHGWWGPEG